MYVWVIVTCGDSECVLFYVLACLYVMVYRTISLGYAAFSLYLYLGSAAGGLFFSWGSAAGGLSWGSAVGGRRLS